MIPPFPHCNSESKVRHWGHTQAVKGQIPVWTPDLSDVWASALASSTNNLGLPRLRRFPGQGAFHFKMRTDLDEMVTLPFPVSPKDTWWLRLPVFFQGSLLITRPFLTPSSHAGHWAPALWVLPDPCQFLFSLFLGQGLNQRGPCYRRKSPELKIRSLEPAPYFTLCGTLGK